jgi:S-DNA-T family DNA segregation ATPase FtsK/SpoIIIE
VAVVSVARSESTKTAVRLPARKGSELLGLLFLTAALLLLTSLLTFDPRDPSVLHRTGDVVPVRNLVGPFGAEVAALAYGLLGLPALLVPVLLLLGAWQRLRPGPRVRVLGRGVGISLVMAVLPVLFQLLVGALAWRAQEIDAGGAVGVFLAGVMTERLNFVGALVVLLGLFATGAALATQSSLAEAIGRIVRRLAELGGRLWLGVQRRRERREKELARRRVVAKHLERARGERRSEVAEVELLPAPPLRVVERLGQGGFSLRRIRSPVARAPLTEPGAAVDGPEPPLEPVAEPLARRPASRRPATEAPQRPQAAFPFAAASKRDALPPINLLSLEEDESPVAEDELVRLGDVICRRCREFGVEGTIEGISPGPVITVFEFQPAPGVKVSQIVNLQDDLALALKAEAIRIDRLPGRSTLGIEVPSSRRSVIHLGPLIADEGFQRSPSPLTMAIGKTLQGRPYYGDLATMPHLLVAGATGAGKSVGLQSMVTSILYKAPRDRVQFIFIDPKRIELGVYADIPHLKAEVVVEPKKAANALRWAVAEMERRYRLLAEVHVRSIDYYNRAIADPEVQKRLALREEEDGSTLTRDDLLPLPYYVVVIDELADLMMVATSDVEAAIARLAQMARAVGIHLIVATQRPSVDVLTGTIKANFPCRISFATASRHDSRTILDQVGAEKLLGKGDMLFMPPGSSRPIRLHGAYVSEQETAALVRWLKKQGRPELDPRVLEEAETERGAVDGGGGGDELFDEAARLVVSEGQASASFLQRRMRVGFSRAARLIDMMEQDGILGPSQGSKPREILVDQDYFTELDRSRES